MSEFTDAMGAKKGGTKPTGVRTEPIWQGPEVDGVTFSLLSRFLACRERFRLRVVEGLVPRDRFNHRLEFGNLWHVCEESLAAGGTLEPEDREPYVMDDLHLAVEDLSKRYPAEREEIANWAGIVRVMFPLHVEHWVRHPDVAARRPLLSEAVFSVPYRLPSGRTVRLRGKWDSVDLVGGGKRAAVWLQENKTKGRVDERLIARQLTFDLQTMLYVVALDDAKTVMDFEKGERVQAAMETVPFAGVRYNVVKRPGQHRGKRETQADFLRRLEGIVRESPGDFFKRWNVALTADDVARFRRECLDPILEQMCSWWEVVSTGKDPYDHAWRSAAVHWRHPFGVYSPMDEGAESDLDGYLADGSEVGLTRTDDLFPELK